MKRAFWISLCLLVLVGAFAHCQAGPRPKVGLVLGGGGARGTAHIGVLKVLERESIPVDLIVGNSFGAVVGGLFAAGYNAQQIERIVLRTDWNDLFDDRPEREYVPLAAKQEISQYLLDLGLKNFQPLFPRGISSGQKITQLLRTLTLDASIASHFNFDSLPIPFRAVATDLLTGQPFVFKEGELADALRASVSFPILFTPFRYRDLLLVDGALTNNVPVDVAMEMGADFVIAVNVSAPLRSSQEIKDLFDVFDQSLTILVNSRSKAKLEMADFLFTPDLGEMTSSEFDKVGEGILAGEEVAEKDIQSLRDQLQAKGMPLRSGKQNRQLLSGTRAPVIAKVGVTGNVEVPSDQILRATTTRRGEGFQLPNVTADVQRIFGMGLFQSVDLQVGLRDRDSIELNYVVAESNLNRLGLGLRYDLDYQFLGRVDFHFKNLFGPESELFFANQIGNLKEFRLGMRSPRLFGSDLYLRPSLFYKQRERLFFLEKELLSRYLDNRVGGEVFLGLPINRAAEINVRYRLEQSDIFGGIANLSQQKPQLVGGFKFGFWLDTVDKVHFPEKGGDVRFDFTVSRRSLGSDFDFNRYSLNLSRHHTFRDRGTLTLTGFLGGTRGSTPFFEQFYLGGVNYTAGSSQLFYGLRRDEFLSRNMGVANVGYRHRLQKTNFSLARALYLGFNYSVAGVKLDVPRPSTRTSILHGFGVGLYLDTFIGPVRLDTGFAENGRANLYLSVGPEF